MAGERSVDTDRPADEAWILSVQSKLYQWSKAHPNDAWRDMWGWMTDLRHVGLDDRPPDAPRSLAPRGPE